MPDEVHGGGFRRWKIPYEKDQVVRWRFYDWDKLMKVTGKTQNSLTMREYGNENFLVIEYEEGIDNNVSVV